MDFDSHQQTGVYGRERARLISRRVIKRA
jgi:hypothetical protein